MEKKKLLDRHVEVLKECRENRAVERYKDKWCRIFVVGEKEISVYANGDLFVKECQNENSSDLEGKKARFTYQKKYLDPMGKSPFAKEMSFCSTPGKESPLCSPKNEFCMWKFGGKEDLECSQQLESLLSDMRNL